MKKERESKKREKEENLPVFQERHESAWGSDWSCIQLKKWMKVMWMKRMKRKKK